VHFSLAQFEPSFVKQLVKMFRTLCSFFAVLIGTQFAVSNDPYHGKREKAMRFYKRNWTTYAVSFLAVAIVCVLLAWTAVAKAEIQLLSCDGDGAINVLQKGWNYDGADTYNLNIKGGQLVGPGQTTMHFTTDTPDDPKINSINQVENDEGGNWTGYLVNVTLDAGSPLTSSSYSLSNLAVTSPGDWTSTISQPLTYTGVNGSGQYEYVGKIDMEGGTPVANGDELDFSYKLTFAGATEYHVVQEQVPVYPMPSPIPEPGALMLALSGLLGMAVVRVARRRTRA
jgi:hypothetical protein